MGYKRVPKRVVLNDGTVAYIDYYVGDGVFSVKTFSGTRLDVHTDEFTFTANSPKTFVWDGREDPNGHLFH